VEIDLYGSDVELLGALDSHWRNKGALQHEKVSYV
jgi:hypothetical protein